MNKNRIQLGDNTMSAITKMVDGNPGATQCLLQLMKDSPSIDPDSALGSLSPLISLDEYEIYGTDIYVLWSDICERDSVATLGVLRAVQLGFLDRAILKDAAHRQDYSGREMIDVDGLVKQVQERLPKFGKGWRGM